MAKKKDRETIFEILKKGKQKGYVYNGCTASPDFNFKTCCDLHDYDYQDLSKSRWQADLDLAKCMWYRGGWKTWKGLRNKILAPIYWISVRTLGSSHYRKNQDASISKAIHGTYDHNSSERL